MNISINKAPQCAFKNRTEVQMSANVGCYYCFNIYPPQSITNYTDENKEGVGQTAICPKCGVDSVLPMELYELTEEDLKTIHNHFQMTTHISC